MKHLLLYDKINTFLGYLQPLLNQLQLIANFSVQSQWLYLIDLIQKPVNLNGTFVLDKNQAQYIITPLEKKLGNCFKI
jgi:hypothetical protein